jgi:guanine deaminase
MAARPSATPEPGTTTVAIVDSSIRSPGVASPGGTSAGMTATLAAGSAVDEPATGGGLHRGTTPASGRLALRGDLLDFGSDPAWGDVGSDAVRFRPDHWLLIVDGRIVGTTADAPDASWTAHDHSGRLILPGFIDTHVHSPQLDVIASYGTELLDWLDQHTFPAEIRYADRAHAEAGAALFLDALISHGTTAAVVFPTVHKVSADALFAAGQARGMRLVAGKVLMDRHAPDGLRDASVAQAERDCVDLIARWHGTDRLAYAVTVRFAPTSSPEQLAMAGRLCRDDPSLYMQTHLAENRAEVKWVHELFPDARSYLDVYARAGLLHAKSVFAHGIWLDDADRAALHAVGAQIAHSPSSNLFLGSGLFDWRAAEAAGVAVSIASDVGGGTSLSMLRNCAYAYKVQAMAGQRLTAWKALHAATRGAARALGLEREIGSFDVGCAADVCVWDWAVGPVALRRGALARDLHERTFAFMLLADERNLVNAFVNGVSRYSRDAS